MMTNTKALSRVKYFPFELDLMILSKTKIALKPVEHLSSLV